MYRRNVFYIRIYINIYIYILGRARIVMSSSICESNSSFCSFNTSTMTRDRGTAGPNAQTLNYSCPLCE